MGETDSRADIKQLLALCSLQTFSQKLNTVLLTLYHRNHLARVCGASVMYVASVLTQFSHSAKWVFSLLLSINLFTLLLFTVKLYPEVALHHVGVSRMDHLKHYNSQTGMKEKMKTALPNQQNCIGCKMVECSAKFRLVKNVYRSGFWKVLKLFKHYSFWFKILFLDCCGLLLNRF